MPTVNIFSKNSETNIRLAPIIKDLKIFLAEKLTTGDLKLTPEEISIRFLTISGGEMIAEVELEITAHAFPERVKNQDKICLDIMDFIKEKTPLVGDVRVWLKLCELGHSWQ